MSIDARSVSPARVATRAAGDSARPVSALRARAPSALREAARTAEVAQAFIKSTIGTLTELNGASKALAEEIAGAEKTVTVIEETHAAELVSMQEQVLARLEALAKQMEDGFADLTRRVERVEAAWGAANANVRGVMGHVQSKLGSWNY